MDKNVFVLPKYVDVILHIQKNPGCILGDIHNITKVSFSYVVVICKELEKRKLITYLKVGRNVKLDLTDTGKHLVDVLSELKQIMGD